MKKSGTVIHGRQSDSPAPRHLPLVDILVDAQDIPLQNLRSTRRRRRDGWKMPLNRIS